MIRPRARAVVRGVVTALLVAAVVALALWAFTRAVEDRLTWFPVPGLAADPAGWGLRCEDHEVRTADGLRLHAWRCAPAAGRAHRADLLLLHGNAGNLGHRLAKIRALAGLGIGVFAVDYRGFGRSEGRPTDAGVLRDAEAAHRAFRALARPSGLPLGLYGESVGALPAVRLAARDPQVAFLILEGAFPGKRAVVGRLPPYWPFLPFVGRELDMAGAAAAVRAPVLVMHARDDEVIPLRLGRAVHDLLSGSASRELHVVPRGGHNDAFAVDPGFFPRIDAFLSRILPGEGGGAAPGGTDGAGRL